MACLCFSFFVKCAGGGGGCGGALLLLTSLLVCVSVTLFPFSCLGSQEGCKKFRAGAKIYHIFFLFFLVVKYT